MRAKNHDQRMPQSALRVFRRPAFVLLAIALIALALRLWGISFGLPMRTHVDEPAYVVSSLRIASGDLWLEYPLLSPNVNQFLLALSYGVLFVAGKVMGVYSSAAAFGQSYLTDPTPFYLIARVISAVFSTATVVVLYAMAKLVIGRNAALLAALLLSVMFIDVRHAHFAEPYALISLIATSSVFFALRFANDDRARSLPLLLSTVLAGAAIALRFSMIPLLAAPVVAVLAQTRSQRQQSNKVSLAVRKLLLVFAGSVLGFVLAYPGVILRPNGLLEALRLYSGLATASAGFEGFVFNPQGGAHYYITMFIGTLGIPMLISSLVGLAAVLVAPGKTRWVLTVFPVTYFVLIGLSQMAFLRYSVPLMPFLALFAAAGIAVVMKALEKRWNTRIAIMFAVFACIIIIFQPLKNTVMLDRLLTTEDTRSIAKQWIEENIPAGSKIALQWYSPPLSTVDDPEPGSRKVYDAHVLNPFDGAPKLYTMDTYREDGFEYIVVSSFIYQLARVDPLENQQRADFYRTLATDAQLLAEFKPADDNREIPFMFEEMWSPIVSLEQRDRTGPAIKIYRIRP